MRVAPEEDGGKALKLIASLLVLGGLGTQTMGCQTVQAMLPGQTEPNPADLAGGELPLRATCTVLSRDAAQQIPIQYRDRLSRSVAVAAFEECIEVMVVMVSVAMGAGDTTQDGVESVEARLAGAEAQVLADTCDEHFRAWRFLHNPERGYLNALDGPDADSQYDDWMDRCYRVLRPLSVAGTTP